MRKLTVLLSVLLTSPATAALAQERTSVTGLVTGLDCRIAPLADADVTIQLSDMSRPGSGVTGALAFARSVVLTESVRTAADGRYQFTIPAALVPPGRSINVRVEVTRPGISPIAGRVERANRNVVRNGSIRSGQRLELNARLGAACRGNQP